MPHVEGPAHAWVDTRTTFTAIPPQYSHSIGAAPAAHGVETDAIRAALNYPCWMSAFTTTQ